MEEFSFRSKRLPRKTTTDGRWGQLGSASSLWQLFVSSCFTTLAFVYNHPAQHLLWSTLRSSKFKCVSFFLLLTAIFKWANMKLSVSCFVHATVHANRLKTTQHLLLTTGSTVVVCCWCLSFGFGVTGRNDFKVDSLPPCFRSIGLSEDRVQEEENRSVFLPRHVTRSQAQL